MTFYLYLIGQILIPWSHGHNRETGKYNLLSGQQCDQLEIRVFFLKGEGRMDMWASDTSGVLHLPLN